MARIKIDPVKIGETPDGQPIWLDPADLIPTPDENIERWSKTLDNRKAAAIDRIAQMVLKNALIFMEATFWETTNQTGRRLYESGNAPAALAWATEHGYEAIQDGLRTIVKKNGKILREMNAKIQPSLAPLVERRINEIVKKMPMPK